MNLLIQLKKAAPIFLVAVACFGLLPTTRAVSPPPDGGYPNFTTAEGTNALQSLTTGSANTAVGWYSLFSNADASFNTGVGAATLLNNTIGYSNTAIGTVALFTNSTGAQNTAIGSYALFSNTTGFSNTADSFEALYSNTTGQFNTAIGAAALFENTTGFQNTASGFLALEFNTTGAGNTAIGNEALASNTTGGSNTAIGDRALFNNTTGIINTAVGVVAGSGVTTASNVISIGSPGGNVSNSCFIGNIYGVMGGFGTAVYINSSGQLFTINSSKRFKDDIKPMAKASEGLFALKPVTFHYKHDSKSTPQFGLVAEDVAKVNPDLVIRDRDGKPFTVRYEAVNAMLLNEFLREHKAFIEEQRKVQEQETTITQLKKDFGATIAHLTARLDDQATQIQKVNAQLAAASSSPGGLEASKFATGRIRGGGPAPQVVNNP